VSKVQEGWEKGFYTSEEVQTKLAKHREAIARGETEIERLREQMANRSLSAIEAELLRHELKALRDRNLWESTFEERADLVARLGIRILPSEDLKSRKIFCRLNLAKVDEEREQAGLARVTFGWPKEIRTLVDKTEVLEKILILLFVRQLGQSTPQFYYSSKKMLKITEYLFFHTTIWLFVIVEALLSFHSKMTCLYFSN